MVGSFDFPEPYEGPDGNLVMPLQMAMVEAVKEINRGRSPFHLGEVGVGDWPDHPDLRTVKDWLAVRKAEGIELEVIYWLARVVRTEWAQLPRRTVSEHRAIYARVQRLCAELAEAMNETGSFYHRGGGHGLMAPSVAQLLTDSEKAVFDKVLEDSGGLDSWEGRWAFPRMDELLERVGQAGKRLHDAGPLHAQPAKRGAERGYFVRRMGQLFVQRYGEASAEVIAAVTSVSLGEITDRELVAKLLK